MAPENYKRPTALITPKMIEQAVKTLQDLGLEDAVHRRHAKLSDVDINSVLFVDRSVVSKLKNGTLTDVLMPAATATTPSKPTTVSIDDFLTSVLPKAKSVSLKFDSHLLPNLMSLTAPVYPSTTGLLKWDNDFAWSYNGNVTDSIKERVKKAGGRVENVKLRCSLAWNNRDDLDLHCRVGKNHISYMDKQGILDVDMNAGVGTSDNPVENMRWVTSPPDGEYKFTVNNFNNRTGKREGFEVEFEYDGQLIQLNYPKAITSGATVHVATLTVKKVR